MRGNFSYIAIYIFIILFISFARNGNCESDNYDPIKGKKYFERGIKFFEKKKYEDALLDFEASYKYRPHWKIKYNIALCHYELGNYLDSAKFIDEFMEEGKGKINEEEKNQANSLIEKLKLKLGAIIFEGRNEQGKISIVIDGKEFEGKIKTGKEIYILPGIHRIIAKSEGKILIDEQVIITAGESKKMDIPEMKSESSMPEDLNKGGNNKKSKHSYPKELKWKILGWTFVGVASAVVVCGIVTAGLTVKENSLMKDAESDYMKYYNEPWITDEELKGIIKRRDEHYEKSRTFLFTTIGLAVTGAIMGASSALILLIPAREKKEKQITFRPEILIAPSSISFNLSW